MTFEIGFILGIVVITIVLFSIEKISADVIALGIIVVLVLSGVLPLNRALAGIGSDAFILILGLLVMTAALEKNGVVNRVGDWILRKANFNNDRFVLIVMLAAAGLSGLMSNTGATAFFLPVVIGMAKSSKISRSKLLMPLAFASILASSVTLISTTTNIVVSGIMEGEGMASLGIFELTPVGIPIVILGILYMTTIGKKLIPDRPYDEPFSVETNVRNYLTELVLPKGSDLHGKTLAQAALGRDMDLTVLRIEKPDKSISLPTASTILKEGDVLIVEGDRDNLLNLKDNPDLQLKPQRDISDHDFQSETIGMYEVILLPRSPLVGRSLKQLNFRYAYGIQVLGINRSGKIIRSKMSSVRLAVGDQLLLHGSRASAVAMDQSQMFRLLQAIRVDENQSYGAKISILIFLGVLILAALNVLPIPIAALLGMLLVFITGCITPEEAYRAVNWQSLIMISGMLALGFAIQDSGAAVFLSQSIVGATQGMGSLWLLGGFFLLSMLLSQPLSNQAAAVVVVPIAIQTAIQLGLNPRSFAVMITLGASCSFLTPLEPSCMMVYGPGNYRFMDFFKVGFPLTLIIFFIAMVMVPVLWPL